MSSALMGQVIVSANDDEIGVSAIDMKEPISSATHQFYPQHLYLQLICNHIVI